MIEGEVYSVHVVSKRVAESEQKNLTLSQIIKPNTKKIGLGVSPVPVKYNHLCTA